MAAAERARVETASRSQLGDARYADQHRSGRLQAETILAELVASAQLTLGRHQ